MSRFGWTSLAYLLFVVTVVAVLVRLDSLATETSSQAAEILPQATATTQEEKHATVGRRASTTDPVMEAKQTTGMTRRIEGAASSLVDLEGRAPAVRSQGASSPTASGATTPVFYRPSSEVVSDGAAGPVCGDLGRFPTSSKVVFPLEREYFYSYEDTWGAPRTQGGHEGTDLMAPTGAPEYALTDGTVVPVAGSNQNGWNTLGGYAVMIRADYSIGPVEEGDLFYYAHLQRKGDLELGSRVVAGQVLGYAGDTGQGPEVTSNLFPPHLHLGWYDGTGGSRSTVDSGAMNPYPLLEWIKANGGAVTGGSDARYCEAPSPPSSGEKGWPAPAAPGVRPDLDTGSNNPKPSPVLSNEVSARNAPARSAASAQRAAPTKQPALDSQDPAPHENPRGASAKAPEIERTRPFRLQTPATLSPDPRASERGASRHKDPVPASPEPAPPGPEIPRRDASEPPTSHEPPAPDPAGEYSSGETQVGPGLQQVLERWLRNLDPAEAGEDDRPAEDERREKESEKRDREGKPATNEPGQTPTPPTGEDPTEEEPRPPEPDEPDPETNDPETTGPGPETTVSSETTEG